MILPFKIIRINYFIEKALPERNAKRDPCTWFFKLVRAKIKFFKLIRFK